MSEFDFDAPSFSLGLDFDPDSQPQPGFDAPSFSLGLDFDLDPQPAVLSRPASASKRPLPTIIEEDDDDDFESPVRVSNLKRLRRGPTPNPISFNNKFDDNDDIENFSSDEDSHCPTGHVSTCSSSKSSLREKKILTSESAKQSTSRIKRDFSTASAEEKKNGNNINNTVFPELTISPLRRFQLVVSDSEDDEPHVSRSKSKKLPHVSLSSKEKQSSNAKAGKYQTQDDDLWKDFCPEKSSNVPTPAFDEVCSEYFSSAKQKTGTETHYKEASNHAEVLLPAHSYFFHNDPRIQKLVRDRLPNFFPLGAGNNQQNESAIDYMGQFGSNECSSSRQAGGKNMIERNSAGTKKNVKKSRAKNVSLDSETWINPKSSEGLSSKDAGKRRVQADGKSAGHWFTGSDGHRVYVNKGGQELTGRMAYIQYKKESGKGFKNSKKQAGTQKKAATKKKSGPKKK